jgi:hypothetical protein
MGMARLNDLTPPSASLEDVSARPRLAVRRLRILFVVQEGTLLRFALLIPALAERGHEIHIAFASGRDWQRAANAAPKLPPPRSLRLVGEMQEQFPLVTYSLAPKRPETDAWRAPAWIARALADLAHNANPRYAHTRPRLRTKKRILRGLRKGGEFEPLGRWLALRLGTRVSSETNVELSQKMLEIAARLEEAIPTSALVDRYVREIAPDIVLTTGTFRHVSSEVDFMKSARRLGIPGGIFIASWDNLVNKGSLKFTPERVFVWNEIQKRDAVELHGIPEDRVRATGAHVFDEWFQRRPTRSREELLGQLGLDAARPYLLYLCSSGPVVFPHGEIGFVKDWIQALRTSSDERLRRINVVVRPHPNTFTRWDKSGTDLGSENVVLSPAQGVHPVAAQARADFFDTLAHSAAVVGINTTAMIEAAILGKSVLTVIVPDFAQETSLHFQYLLPENGGFLHVARSLGEHIGQIRRVLDDDAADPERLSFVESFVRPGGIDRPAAPIAVTAIEELADIAVDTRTRFAARLLRAGLSVEAGLSAAYGFYRRNRRGGRKSDRIPL